jgi:cyclin B
MNQNLSEEDQKTSADPLECSEYVSEIYAHLKNTELEFIAQPGYMKKQPDINEKMRAILIDWLVEVHLKFKLYPETLYLTVNLIDRYLEKKEVLRQHLQLVGVTAMLIASKYEEIYAPEVRDFVYITDKAYTKEEILKMEFEILTSMDFNVTTPSCFRFLERIYKLFPQADERVFNLSRYLMELSLVEYRMLKHHPSMLASAALFLSMKILKKEHSQWTEKLKDATWFSEQQIRQCAKDLCILLQNIET